MLNTRELIKNEIGPQYTPYGKKIKACLAYPNNYSIGMANLGFQTIYHLLNSNPDTYCDRVFYTTDRKIFSFETNQSLTSFDFLFFSISFELDYPHIIGILDKGKIPLYSSERDETYPLVGGGGVCTFLNPEPIASFFDFFVIGEAEEIIGNLMAIFNNKFPNGFKTKNEKTDFLEEISNIEGVYVPQSYHFSYKKDDEIEGISNNTSVKIKRLWIRDMNQLPILPQTISPLSEFGKMFLMEIGRGCPYKCNFCGATAVYKPYRYRSLEIIKKILEKANYTDTIGLISPAISLHPQLEALLDFVSDRSIRVSLSSLRIDKIDKKMALFLSESGQKTVTLAPECGSQRMRDLVNKNLNEEKILEAIQNLVDKKIKNIKLYFMIGLPEETEEDIFAIYALTQKIRNVTINTYKYTKKLTQIVLHITPYVPKPHTPWQKIPMLGEKELKKKILILQKVIRSLGSIQLEIEDVKGAILQSILSRGDRRLSNFIISLYKEKKSWKTICRDLNFPGEKYLSVEHYGNILPWEHIS